MSGSQPLQLHLLTYVCAVVVVVALVVKNLDDSNHSQWITVLPQRCEHGWPVTFLERAQDAKAYDAIRRLHGDTLSRWAIAPGSDSVVSGSVVTGFSALAIVTNVLVGVVIVTSTMWSVERLARHHQIRAQISLKVLLATTALVASGIVLFADERMDWPYVLSTLGTAFGLGLFWYAVLDVLGILLLRPAAGDKI